jgi:hypothetical protein
MARLAVLAVFMVVPAPSSAAAPRVPPEPQPVDLFKELADDVIGQTLNSDIYKSKVSAGHKLRVVVGNIDNKSDDESVRVEDMFNDMRDRLVATQTVRLFDPGELNADLIISPELTSRFQLDSRGRRRHCFILRLTLSTVEGEFATSYSSTRCDG